VLSRVKAMLVSHPGDKVNATTTACPAQPALLFDVFNMHAAPRLSTYMCALRQTDDIVWHLIAFKCHTSMPISRCLSLYGVMPLLTMQAAAFVLDPFQGLSSMTSSLTLTLCLLAAVHAGAVCSDAQLPALGQPAVGVWRVGVWGEPQVDPAVRTQGARQPCYSRFECNLGTCYTNTYITLHYIIIIQSNSRRGSLEKVRVTTQAVSSLTL
jgi:hypothetical protein